MFGELKTFRLRYRSAQGDRFLSFRAQPKAQARGPEGRTSVNHCDPHWRKFGTVEMFRLRGRGPSAQHDRQLWIV